MSDTRHLDVPARKRAPDAPRRLGLGKLHRVGDLPAILKRRRFEPVRAAFYDELWQAAAAAVGATWSRGPRGLHRIQKGRHVTYTRESDVMLDSAITLSLVGERALCFDYFAARGLPVPAYREFSRSNRATAEAFLRETGGPVVVKPARGTGGGRGVTTRISTPAGLRRAIARAARFGPRLVIEQQLFGASFRLLYLDGRFLDAVRRDPPMLAGDGTRSLRRLVADENRRRLGAAPTALSPLLIDSDMHNCLAAQGLSLSHVPARGEAVTVKGASNENAAAQNHAVRDQVHPDTVDRIGRVVGDMGVGFAGVDLIAEDIAQPLESGSVFVGEINANPGIHHHVLIAEPSGRVPVAQLVLEHLFSTGTGVMVA